MILKFHAVGRLLVRRESWSYWALSCSALAFGAVLKTVIRIEAGKWFEKVDFKYCYTGT